jgi:cell division protein FtsW
LILITAALVVFGWLVLYSASALVADSRFGDQYYFLKRQILWSALGAGALLLAMRVPASVGAGERAPSPSYGGGVVGLGLVMGHEVGGAKRWLRVGGFGFNRRRSPNWR